MAKEENGEDPKRGDDPSRPPLDPPSTQFKRALEFVAWLGVATVMAVSAPGKANDIVWALVATCAISLGLWCHVLMKKFSDARERDQYLFQWHWVLTSANAVTVVTATVFAFFVSH